MKVLLINPPAENLIKTFAPDSLTEEMGFYPPMGLLYIAAYAEKIHGDRFQFEVLDQPSISKEKVAYYHNIFPWAILYPRLSFLIKILCRLKVTREKSIYDVFFPLVKTVYEIYHRFKVSLNLLPGISVFKRRKS